MDALIPKKALLELVKISRDPGSDVSFGEDQNHIYFEVDGRLLITRKLSGTFPNYEMVIPKDNDKTAIFDADEMKSAVRRVSLMADERMRSVKLTIRPGEVEIGAQSSEEGEGQEKIPADYSGDEVSIGFNAQYLQEFLNVVGAADSSGDDDEENIKTSKPRIALEFKDGSSQTQMRINGDESYKYIVMPLRI